MARRLNSLLALSLCAVLLSACAGVVDVDGSALDQPPGGWDRHGPG